MLTKLAGITEAAKHRPKEKFTSLAHLINVELLRICHDAMDGKKAVGIDKVTKEAYNENLEDNLTDLIARMKRQAYHPQPVRRVNILKQGSDKKRPLGILSYEDKLVQAALAKILSAIYEPEFLNFSFGFRPGRGCHDALRALNEVLYHKPINYIVDVDIKGFFDHVNHDWLIQFIENRIQDPNIIRLIKRMLKAGSIENFTWHESIEGTVQGGSASPILANIYLHYVVDLWFEKHIRKRSKGAAYMVRYADDQVFCFQYKEEAEEFYTVLKERLRKFGLEISEEKSKIIAFGRNAGKEDKNDKSKGAGGKPETFDFLGFTHYCSKSQYGNFMTRRKTSATKAKAILLRVKEWIRVNRHYPKPLIMETLTRKLRGYYQYYGVWENWYKLKQFYEEVKKHLFKNLNQRSQKRSYTWDKFILFVKKYPLPKPKVYVDLITIRPEIGTIL